MLWQADGPKAVKPVRVLVGLSDGDYTELIEGEGLQAGSEVLTGVNKAGA